MVRWCHCEDDCVSAAGTSQTSSSDNTLITTPSIPIRTLPLIGKIYRSTLMLAQQNINFGQLQNFGVLQKQLQIHNASEIPLMFNIRKSGSISSGDIQIPSITRGYCYSHYERHLN